MIGVAIPYHGLQLGVFQPKRLDTLRPEFHKLIGKEIFFRYGWVMDDYDPYPGQVAYVIYDPEDRHGIDCHGMWFPEEDIKFERMGKRPIEGVHSIGE